MKRMLKKLSAIALAGAMALSLSVSALADTDVGSISAASGTTSGTGYTTGGIPEAVIKVKLPTSVAAGTFDLRLDPHNLIRQSGNATQIGGSSEVTFATDTLAYFKNVANDTTSFSATSDPIKVINKSSVPITVGMTATWDKKTATYSLAKDADDLAKAKADGKAALYLYLKEDLTNTTSPVVETDKGAPTFTWDYTKEAGGDDEATITKADLTKLNKYIKNVKFEYTEAADTQDMENINKGTSNHEPTDWTLAFTAGTASNSSIKFPTLSFSNVGNVINSYRTPGSTSTAPYKVTNGNTTVPEIIPTSTLDGKTYAMKEGTEPVTILKIQRGSTDIALISIEWDYEAVGAGNGAITEAVTKSDKTDTFKLTLTAHSGSGANLKTDLNLTDGAYQLTRKGATGADAEKFKWDTAEGFDYSEENDDKWQSVSFRLTAAITDGDVCAAAWDTAFPDTLTTTQMDLTWVVSECKAIEPSAKVTSALAADNGTATLKVDWGYGTSKTNTISAAYFTTPAGAKTDLNLDSVVSISGNTVTITSTNSNGIFNANGGNGVITLTFKHAETGYTKNVTVDLKTAS